MHGYNGKTYVSGLYKKGAIRNGGKNDERITVK